MKHNVLLYSFVGILNKIQTTLPILDNDFTRNLFSDPINTNSGLSAEGIFISQQINLQTVRFVNIGPQKIQVTSPDLKEISVILKKIETKLSENSIEMKFRIYGLSEEIEVLEIGEEKISQWLSDKFVLKGLNLKGDFADAQIFSKSINFDIVTKSTRKFNVEFQPRTNKENILFLRFTEEINSIVDTNDLKEIEISFDQLTDYISINFFKTLQ